MIQRQALVVDDSRSARYAMRKYLERYRYDVTTAEDAREALGYLRDHRPLVIFLDYLMPGTNGLEVLRAIKSDPNTVGIPVVICTSVERADFKQQARWSGAVEVLQKPPSLDRLERLLAVLERAAGDAAAATPSAAGPAPAPSSNVVPLPLPESAQRYAALRDEIDTGLHRLTDEMFVQLAELKGQITQVERAGMSREEYESFRAIARDEADALNNAVRLELDRIRQRLDAMDQLQRQDREEVLATARSIAASEAQAVAAHTVRSSVTKFSGSLTEAIARALDRL
jgi:CheY-like chemotaxis protein